MENNSTTGLVFGAITSMVTGIFKPMFGLFTLSFRPLLTIEMSEQVVNLLYVFVTGFIGAFGGLIATWLWKKIIKK